MRKVALVLFFVLLSLFIDAQNNRTKGDELQQDLNSLQYGIGSEDSVRFRLIDIEIELLKKRNDSLIFQYDLLNFDFLLLQAKALVTEDSTKSLALLSETKRNDSLILQYDLLNSDLLLLQAKALATEDRTKSLATLQDTRRLACNISIDSLKNVLVRERALCSKKATVLKDNIRLETDTISGYYIVIASFRKSDLANIRVNRYLLKNPGIRLFVVQNPKKTWYHICINVSLQKKDVVKNILRYRKIGYTGAWAIILR
jgi:hypothetical protein